MNFEFNSHLLPTEINVTQSNGASKVLDLNWSPITDDTGTTLRLLLCVRDVTDQRALARAAEAQQRELTIIGEILGVRHEKFHEFIDGAEQFIAENRSIVSGPDAPTGPATKDAVGLLYRNMHTIKGNARTHGLLTLTNVLHRAEQTYDNLRNGTGTWDSAQLLAELNEVANVVGEYAAINHDKLGRRGPGRRGNPDQFALVPRETVQRLIARLEDLPGSSAAAIEAAMLETRAALRQFGTERVTDVLSGVVDSLPSLARELGKEPPVTRIADDDVVVRGQLSSTLRNVFMHLYRNALDHGIESTADRQSAGKSPAGRIDLDVALTEDTLRMVMRDDGRGLALQRIRRKAIELGMLDGAATPAAADLARLILEPGFSTADKVTEVSGRGVGMDAVRGFIEAEGGTLELVVKPEVSGDAEYVEFETVISLPRALAEQALA
jgi:two-component system chemotaxis sensor kinase CheA